MQTMFRVTTWASYRIEQVAVLRASEKTIWFRDGTRCRRVTEDTVYFNTFREAHDHALVYAHKALEAAKERVRRIEAAMVELDGVTEDTIETSSKRY